MTRIFCTWLTITTLLVQPLWAQTLQRPGATTEPATPNLPGQKLGANDLIAVSVYNAPELTRTVRVSTDGTIRLPMLKEPVAAAGSLPTELEGAIATALKTDGVLVNPIVTVTVAEYASRPISIMGAVRRPTTIQATGPMTLLDALARAEGLSATAGAEILVSVRAPGSDMPVTRRIPVKSLMEQADPQYNVTLRGGEEIRVPEVGRIFVVGNVKKAGSYPVPDGGQMTVLQLLAMSEGLLPYSSNEAYVYRQGLMDPKNGVVVDLDQILKRRAPDVALAANDTLYIPVREGRKTTMGALSKLLAFGAATVSGILIYGTVR